MFTRNTLSPEKGYNPMGRSENSLVREYTISSNKRSSSCNENDCQRDPKGRRIDSDTFDDENVADTIKEQILKSPNCPSKSPFSTSMTSTPSMPSTLSMITFLLMSSKRSTNSSAETSKAQMIFHISTAVLMKDLEIGKVNILLILFVSSVT